MFQRLHNIFIAPQERDPDIRNRVVVFNILLVGTFLLLVAALFVLISDWIGLGHDYLDSRILSINAAIAFVATLFWLSRSGHFRLSAALLVGLYFAMASLVIYRWGISTPTGVLLFGLVIMLGGILLGPRYSLYFAAGSIGVLTLCQWAADKGLIDPDWSWLSKPPTIGDVFGPGFIFVVIALVSWLFNYRMEESLHRAIKAESALTKQKALLETTVEERTRELQIVQVEKIQQMYRFAELGQLSTALMHELSNHLTSLTLDIEGLKDQNRSHILSRAKRSIRYIDDMVVRVRDQLQGKKKSRPFNVIDEIDAVVKMLRHKAQAFDVLLKWRPSVDKKPLRTRGDAIRLRQLMANLISNGIDAYFEPRDLDENRDVQILVGSDKRNVIITVSDWGRGIPAGERAKLFEPFFSTKQTGMGMGLFIAKQIVEEHFLGTIKIDETKDHTVFIITLPRADA